MDTLNLTPEQRDLILDVRDYALWCANECIENNIEFAEIARDLSRMFNQTVHMRDGCINDCYLADL